MASLFNNSTSKDHIKTMHAEDRIISFEIMDGTKHVSSTGLIDPRLFKGGNRLHAQRDDGGLWIVRYDKGDIPPALKQHWTHFSRLVQDVEAYFNSRNVAIKRIED